MAQIDPSAPVLITGATGYIGGHVASRFLAEGATVSAPVRNPDDRERLAPLRTAADASPGVIEFSRADLNEPGSYDEAAAGCELIVHTASPFTLTVDDAQKELVDPAVNGTSTVLDAASRGGTAKRVVITSSCAAIYSDAADMADEGLETFTEDHWNTRSTLEHNPYSLSKTLAERKAWEMAAAQDQWDLVTINPSFAVGPALAPGATSESFALVTQFVDGTLRTGTADLHIGAVHVRDVAEAHYQAAVRPNAAGRYITSGENVRGLDLLSAVERKYGKRLPLPRRYAPKAVLWLLGPLITKGVFTRKMISRSVGIPLRFDNTKARTELGIDFSPPADAVLEMVDQMIDAGIVTPKPA